MRLTVSYKIGFACLSGFLLLLIPLLAVQAKEPVFVDIRPATLERTPSQLTNLKPLLAVGDPLPRIQCTGNYSASIYAEGLSSPDGLAFNPAGLLHVAEETAGRVSQVSASGVVTPILSGLSNPEGIAFDPDGNLYVVEDIQNGRLLKQTPGGITSTLGTNLDAPEGVVWHPNGNIYITESNVQFAGSPFDYRAYVTKFTAGITQSRIATTAFVHSYGGITVGADNLLYIANEASGVGTNNSVLTVNPDGGTPMQFTNGLTSPEGLRFSVGGQFPLYVVEEDLGAGNGRLSQIASNGLATPFCAGFFSIEDVALDSGGNFYVSEDTTGYIILIEALTSTAIVSPVSLSIRGPISGTVGQTYTFSATVQPISATLPLTYIWQATDYTPATYIGGLSHTVSYGWGITGSKTIQVVARNSSASVTASHIIDISAFLPEFKLYLPLILKN